MAGGSALRIVDARAGGDISRVIIDGAPDLHGETVALKCEDFARRHDGLRLKLIQPPHGELHMCPVLLLPPCAPDADFGVIIMESMGYPPISGSNLFCATAVALQHGFAAMREPETRLRVETPAGVIAVIARCRNGRCHSVEFENTPARIRSQTTIPDGTTGEGLALTVVSAGVDYAVVDALGLDIRLVPESRAALLATGERIARHAGTDFTLFHGALESTAAGGRCRVAVFQSPAVICRSPTGTGTSALLVLLHSRGLIDIDQTLTTISPGGHAFSGRILAAHQNSNGFVLRTAISGDVVIGRELTIR
ncbi:MAG: proline racemase family protein [Arenicellales bacterium]